MTLTLKRPEKLVSLCLDGSLRAQWEEADARLSRMRAEKYGDARMVDPAKELAVEVTALQDRMKADTAVFTLRGMPRKAWEDLITANPPRDGNDFDKSYGFNATAVTEAAIPVSIVKVVKDGKAVKFDPAKDWEALADDMTDIQYEDFFLAVLTVNRGRQEIPFSASASMEMRHSEPS